MQELQLGRLGITGVLGTARIPRVTKSFLIADLVPQPDVPFPGAPFSPGSGRARPASLTMSKKEHSIHCLRQVIVGTHQLDRSVSSQLW